MDVGRNVSNDVSWSCSIPVCGLWCSGVYAAPSLPPSDLGVRIAVKLVTLRAVDLIGRGVVLWTTYHSVLQSYP
jgi:hypothetical protein